LNALKPIKVFVTLLSFFMVCVLNGQAPGEGYPSDFSLARLVPLLPKNVRYLVHVNVQQALREKNGQELKKLWITPMLEAYGTIVSPKVKWTPESMGAITYFGDGVYTNHSEQVYLFKPVSAQWLKKIRESFEADREAPARYGYYAELKHDVVYVSQNKEKLESALRKSENLAPLLKKMPASKGSYIELVFDQQLGDMLALPMSVSQVIKELERFRLHLFEQKDKCFLEFCFDFRTGSDVEAFSKQIQIALNVLQVADEVNLMSQLQKPQATVTGQTLTLKGEIPSMDGDVPKGYYLLLESLFGVEPKTLPN
jgi:hypothetical protein